MFDKPNIGAPKSESEIDENNRSQLLKRRAEFIKLYAENTQKRLGPINSIKQALENEGNPYSPLIVVINYGGKIIKLTLHLNGDIFETNDKNVSASLEHANTISVGELIKFRKELAARFPLIEKEYDLTTTNALEERRTKVVKAVKFLAKTVYSPLVSWDQRFEDPTDSKSPLILILSFSNGSVATLKASLNSEMVAVRDERTNQERNYHSIELE